jgi:DNA helicase-2/ATP-dependent DNA helicase PcrA
MNTSNLLEHLNEQQHAAVTADPGNLLILAGAGSGKTRVLVERIAWLVQQKQMSPFGILAVTFTNKAANEMRARIGNALGMDVRGMWIGTFHSLSHRLLRLHWQDAGLTDSFQILDSEDQFRLIKRLMRSLNIDEDRFPPRQAQWFINNKKDEGLRARHCQANHDMTEEVMIKVYQAYEDTCDQSALVDFAELLLRSHELWLNQPLLLKHYQERFSHILVDEFQDTNSIQYAWLRMLAGKESHVMVVGDDDQSIYSWRGAVVDNIHQFKNDFPNVTSITLEQNYRSTSTILDAANALIKFNSGRLENKQLWTEGAQGNPIRLYAAFNEIDEARFIAETIISWRKKGEMLRDCAVLYRSNAQSRVLEEALLQKRVPYRIYGGFRFFERAEIKDALAYLRLINNRFDDPAFERVVNVPTRGIGERTVMFVRAHAKEHSLSLWQASKEITEKQLLPNRANNALLNFIDLITHISEHTKESQLGDILDYAIETSSLILHHQKEKGEKGRAKVENLRELVVAAREFDFNAIDPEEREALTPLSAFLSHAALEAGDGQADPNEDAVKLMTLHSAKGLEFPLVILCGLEDGLFPHQMSMDEPGRLEEERRLCYVGMTRARQELILTYAECRRTYGQAMLCKPSRFLKEIPAELMEEVRINAKITRPVVSQTPKRRSWNNHNSNKNDSGLRIGQSVRHVTFGEGTILDVEPNGPKSRIQVKFKKTGTKWLLASVAKLEPA